MTIYTVGQLIDFLKKFPRDTRVLKSDIEGDGYSDIVDTGAGTRTYLVTERPKQEQAYIMSKYRDAYAADSGVFEAVVL